jgi:hypothetical protein
LNTSVESMHERENRDDAKKIKHAQERAHAAELAGAWSNWVQTRKFYAPAPSQPNILARNMPSRVGVAPDAVNHPDMVHYNRAVNVLCDLAMSQYDTEKRKRDIAEFTCFVLYYGKHRVPAKEALRTFKKHVGYEIGRRTYYDHIARFSSRAYTMCQTLKKGSDELNKLLAPDLLCKAA